MTFFSNLVFRSAALLAATAVAAAVSLPVYEMAARVAGVGLG